MAQFPPLYASA